MILTAQTLLSYFDGGTPGHWAVAGRIELAAECEELVVSPFVIAELEPMIREKFGPEEWCEVLGELAGGAWTIATVDTAHLRSMREHLAAGGADAEGASCAEASIVTLTYS
ncbi:hypothetical protein [Salinibacterium sp.]|uniref:hypothetical protein n=1 Tax=Salinibacterium sp. TaxID=1915057 RepID=UPI00286A91EB|nr:hypothetical protein [Salinibacterium sp.]